ncbi:malonyl-ACP O-methyltransferase BioC [Candidatus Palibaumannia cicadellinicola]|uniref:Malonyl-[acyl-carrier protein] O-methyltransferase n=1 Tax=Baumannia cicadellinicola subsp. Homalodisca coagulata TaxID=374463 RepID=Q1LTL6_BAUCH|nr:malonyl-ACP O-methyltransferase BioC [Candidatus Baumannia cicadellinicola]ABF14121.1 biotin biosynthesis protein BioC [Baumannia cicadellinicola str. Hc (Homalodisca coagulata)]MCJ7462319.1 malonyl-ACP O-methyltransferase BioC [Candidatus Baumannia cicadellinicola]MCJ7462839.1 malonyl-ACP O-methyltransferase BioC [Candidatus Baumannia cicadellinicola]
MSINNHKQGIARSFSRAAQHYDRYAAFQRYCGERLRSLIGPRRSSQLLLDAGCGTGWFSRCWQREGNYVIALDISAAMLVIAQQQHSAAAYIIGDIEQLPIATSTVECVFSNLAIQWCEDLPQVLNQFHRVLRPGGILAVSTLAYGSLHELELAWRQVDNNIHINRFLPQTDIAAAFQAYNHKIVIEQKTLYYSKLIDLFNEIKGVGASYLYIGHGLGLTSRTRFRALEEAWPRHALGLPLSYQLVYGVLYRD